MLWNSLCNTVVRIICEFQFFNHTCQSKAKAKKCNYCKHILPNLDCQGTKDFIRGQLQGTRYHNGWDKEQILPTSILHIMSILLSCENLWIPLLLRLLVCLVLLLLILLLQLLPWRKHQNSYQVNPFTHFYPLTHSKLLQYWKQHYYYNTLVMTSLNVPPLKEESGAVERASATCLSNKALPIRYICHNLSRKNTEGRYK